MTISSDEAYKLDRASKLNRDVELGTEIYNMTPAYVLKYAGKFTTVGGDATETITVTGVVATDVVFVSIQTAGAVARTIVSHVPGTDEIVVTMSGDPSNDHILSYAVYRALS